MPKGKLKDTEHEPKRQRGRPRSSRIHDIPDQIPDSPENVALALLTTPPKRKGGRPPTQVMDGTRTRLRTS